MNKTQFVCPQCGCPIATPEHTHTATGIAIGKDSNLGNIALPKEGDVSETTVQSAAPAHKPAKTAEQRLAALRAAHIPGVEDMVAMRNGSIGRWNEDGISLSPVDESDPVIQKILAAGSLRHAHLFRQHIMAQMMDILIRCQWVRESNDGWHGHNEYTFDIEQMNHNYNNTYRNPSGVCHQFMLLNEEFYRINAMRKSGDQENLKRNLRAWLPNGKATVIEEMCQTYMNKLRQNTFKLKVHNCKGRAYVRPMGKNVAKTWGIDGKYKGCFVDELEEKFFAKYQELCDRMIDCAKRGDVHQLHHAIEDFCRKMVYVGYDQHKKHCPRYRDAFKYNGCYWTMQNMIDFHDCNFKYRSASDRDAWEVGGTVGMPMTRHESKAYLEACAERYQGKGWLMFGLMKRLFKDSGFDPVAFKEKLKK